MVSSTLTFHILLPNLSEHAEGTKKIYMYNNAEKKINVKEKYRKTRECRDLLKHSHTHMHALNETRNSARYQPAWTCRQKRPWNLAKKMAWNFLMEKSGDKISQAYFLAKGPAVYDFDIYFQARGESFSSSTVCKSQTCYTRKLVCQRARDMWLTNLLSSYSFLIVNCVIMIINNKIID